MSEDSDHGAYSGLLVNDSHWAFGDLAESADHGSDPLAGMDTTVPSGTDPRALASYALALGDDALVMSQRVAQWCSNAPDLEEDIALANIALDLLGQARLLLARAARADDSLVPRVPDDSPVPPEDALAFLRDAGDFRHVRLVEVPNGDFAEVVVRLLLFSTWRLALWERLRHTRDGVLAALAAKGVPELTYHRDFAARWFVVLAGGTEESRRRLDRALAGLWPLWPELYDAHATEATVAASGAGVDPASVRDAADAALDGVFEAAGIERPAPARMSSVNGGTGRDGMHTEALTLMLAEMQSVARAHPMARW